MTFVFALSAFMKCLLTLILFYYLRRTTASWLTRTRVLLCWWKYTFPLLRYCICVVFNAPDAKANRSWELSLSSHFVIYIFVLVLYPSISTYPFLLFTLNTLTSAPLPVLRTPDSGKIVYVRFPSFQYANSFRSTTWLKLITQCKLWTVFKYLNAF